MTKPIRIERHGAKHFIVFVKGAPVVKHEGKLNFDRSVAGIGQDSLPILDPHRFASKKDAEYIAHQIGRYILQQGDMLFAYAEYEDKLAKAKKPSMAGKRREELAHRAKLIAFLEMKPEDGTAEGRYAASSGELLVWAREKGWEE